MTRRSSSVPSASSGGEQASSRSRSSVALAACWTALLDSYWLWLRRTTARAAPVRPATTTHLFISQQAKIHETAEVGRTGMCEGLRRLSSICQARRTGQRSAASRARRSGRGLGEARCRACSRVLWTVSAVFRGLRAPAPSVLPGQPAPISQVTSSSSSSDQRTDSLRILPSPLPRLRSECPLRLASLVRRRLAEAREMDRPTTPLPRDGRLSRQLCPHA